MWSTLNDESVTFCILIGNYFQEVDIYLEWLEWKLHNVMQLKKYM